jgi:RNA recognition motif-containing protein
VPSARRAGDLLINSVFIGSVPQETTEDELRTLFSKAGKVLDKYVDNNQECDGVEIITTSNNNKPNAIAFVTFETDEAARRCISGDLQGTFELRGQVLNVRDRKVRESRGGKTSRG